jgi:hypothetical protein
MQYLTAGERRLAIGAQDAILPHRAADKSPVTKPPAVQVRRGLHTRGESVEEELPGV